ncbi:Membrane-associated enzyme, PAP2 (acid phosphatase) superfamily [Rhodoblastus acidophilus]|uniref:Membrane-associated enzyme, PAP2 (Acid phosphatase) superfamily n=1 Tax=Rhodoblastus acidophilus TaxID=1074 RepID=A0A212R192_RHOAC|nr:phosphatase PAP2 family protein [Rhodoblastus acidophilus]SNB65772.1 Membrane-associated enzyme, PAP2 (acid phosphatase) superfamily [Rhodoblastus acidophilus]
MSPKSTLVLVAFLTLAGLALFAWAPELDLAVAGLFFKDGAFVAASTPAGDVWRRVFWDAPYAALAICLVGYVLRRSGRSMRGPDGRATIFLIATLALGPGLLLNGVLKEHTGRPRPVQTDQFGGDWTFRPYYRIDGACPSNCSFASGEAGTSAWTLAPALLAPTPARPYAVAAALALTAATGALRMAYGGHYLSDVTLAALFTILVVLGGYCWYARGGSRWI